MASASVIDQLDQAMDWLMSNPISSLSPDFKARLKADLLEQYVRPGRPRLVYSGVAGLPARNRIANTKPANALALPSHILATLSGAGHRDYPVQRANFVASFALHAAAM